MRKNRAPLLRRLLAAVALAVALAVAWSLRPRPPRPEPGRDGESVSGGTKVGDMFFVRFREGGRPVEVKARSMRADPNGSTMHLSGVVATLPFVSEGREASATIRAESCVYQPQPLRAAFKGKVVVETDDDFVLETESLDYASETSELRTEDALRFRRGRAQGSARGLLYSGKELLLGSEVKLHVEQPSGPPVDLEAGTARVSREETRVFFEGGVLVREGARELRAQRLQLNMADRFRILQHAAAIEDVELHVGRGAGLPGAAPAPAELGETHLRCRRLNVRFGESGTAEEATAVNPATLELLPGPGDEPEKRRLEGQRIVFKLDAQGRVQIVEAYAGESAEEMQVVVMSTQPLRPGAGEARRVQCRFALVTLDPGAGSLVSARFEHDVTVNEPGRKAWADRADFDAAAGRAILTGREPRIVDEVQGSELRARRIEIGTRSRDLLAVDNVRHTISAVGDNGHRAPAREPTVVAARRFEYAAASKTGRYSENVLLRSGEDEIRAPLMVIEEPAPGRRVMTANGGVRSKLHPRPKPGAKEPPAPLEAQSRDFRYEEKERRVVYTGDVDMRQGDIETKSPEMIVLLGPDGNSVDRVLAGTPVDVRQGRRSATGERATYTAADETLVLVGEKVVARDVDRRLEGRVLTFQVGSDRIRVDGRDEVRSEAVLKRKEPARP